MLKLTCDYKDDYSSGEPSENRHLPQGDRRLRQTKGRSEECLQHHHVSTNAGGHEDEEERQSMRMRLGLRQLHQPSDKHC